MKNIKIGKNTKKKGKTEVTLPFILASKYNFNSLGLFLSSSTLYSHNSFLH